MFFRIGMIGAVSRLLALWSFMGGAFCVCAQTTQTVYTDSLQNGWQDWSWATVNLATPAPVHGGASSIITLFVLPTGTPPQLRASSISSSNTFDFWLDGQAGERYAIL